MQGEMQSVLAVMQQLLEEQRSIRLLLVEVDKATRETIRLLAHWDDGGALTTSQDTADSIRALQASIDGGLQAVASSTPKALQSRPPAPDEGEPVRPA